MNSKTKQLLIALVIGAIAVFGNQAYLSSRIAELKPDKYITVMRAKKAISAGTPLSSSQVQKKKIPKNFAPLTAINWADNQQYLGQEVAVDILPGDYVLQTYFTSRASVGKTLSEQIEGENVRAITLPVDETNSLARSIVSGDHIDIIFNFNIPELSQKVSIVLLQNVPVIATGAYSAVDQELGGSGRVRRYNTLTLKLSATDAVRLNYARLSGAISLMLRNNTDADLLDIPPVVGVNDLLTASDREMINKQIKEARENLPDNSEVRKQLQEYLKSQTGR